MTPERWQRMHSTFTAALAAEAPEREALVARDCADDPGLQADVLEMLVNHERAAAEAFLEVPPWILQEAPESLEDFDKYEQIQRIGHGGMGVVYKARHKQLNNWVALKMSFSRCLAADDDQRRFRAEAESMAKLRHSNIVRVYEVGDHDSRPYFSMDLVEGESLAEQLKRFRDDQRGAARLLQTVARAVHHAHQRGLLHRDLKPENILLDEEGQPHVTDFGLAKSVDDERSPRGIVGTAGYMSPEQADPEQSETVRSDVYGLGAILYALLTGCAPHPKQGRTRRETLRQVREGAPDKPSSLKPDVDPDLEAICLKCLSRRAKERYASAKELAYDLERWLDGKETTARPWSRTERWRGWMRDNPMLAWLAAATAILLALAAILVTKALIEVVREPALAQQALARQQADTVRLRLMQLVQAVDAAAAEPELAHSLARRDIDRIQSSLVAIGERLTDLNGRSPFEAWFILNLDGKIVARWLLPSQEHDRVVFRERDYFKGALARASAPGGPRAYISRVYFGHHDPRYKFGIGRALISEGKPVGVIVASVTTSARLGLPTIKGRTSRTALIARVDPSRISSRHPRNPADHILLMHPAYHRGTKPVPVPKSSLRGLSQGFDERYVDPAAAIDPSLRGTWLAGLAPVKGTEFVVVAQRRYRGSRIRTWAAIGAVGLFVLLIVWRWPRQRAVRRPAPAR